jgi:hypothetical protein
VFALPLPVLGIAGIQFTLRPQCPLAVFGIAGVTRPLQHSPSF